MKARRGRHVLTTARRSIVGRKRSLSVDDGRRRRWIAVISCGNRALGPDIFDFGSEIKFELVRMTTGLVQGRIRYAADRVLSKMNIKRVRGLFCRHSGSRTCGCTGSVAIRIYRAGRHKTCRAAISEASVELDVGSVESRVSHSWCSRRT